MRVYLIPAFLILSACASAPSANRYVDQPLADLQAQQRELANAEARLQQLRTIIDLDDNADIDDIRAYNAARDELSRLQSHYPDVDSGYNDLGWHPLEALGEGTISTSGASTLPGGILGGPASSGD
jgi:hypothetical protein